MPQFVGPVPGAGWSRNRPGGLGGLTRLEEMKVLVCAGDEEAVKEKLEQGMETSNQYMPFTNSPVTGEVFPNWLGFNPNAPLVGDWSPLMYACSNGRLSVVKLLLEKGANVNYQKGKLCV